MSLKGFCKIIILFLLFSLSLQGVFSQESFLTLDKDLQQLEDLINDTIANTEEQQRLLEDLKSSLNESGNLIASYETIITEQEFLLSNLRKQLNEMSETYRMQSALSAKYAERSRFWKTFTLIAIPTTSVISGTVVWVLMR